MRPPHAVLLRPLITEKGTRLTEKNQYLFHVAPDATKIEIRQAVETAFRVDVLDVNVMNVKGKQKRFGRHAYRTSPWRKAVVTLAPGQTIEVFSGV